MKEIRNADELHVLLLSIAKEFHAICVKHNIPYYMLGGTMLGAVRHKAIIPWDDDMDFGIPRERYDEFVKYAHEELSERYKMLTVDSSDYAVLGIGKISDSMTIVPEIYAVNTDEKLGVNIDVFPLDYTDANVGAFSTNWFARRMFKLQKLLFVEAKNRTFAKKILAIVMQTICRIDKRTIPHYIHRIMLNRKCNVEMVANIFGAWDTKEVVPVEIFGKPTLYDFADTKFYGVENYDSYLKRLYGDYMQLPPENKRHIHFENVYMKES